MIVISDEELKKQLNAFMRVVPKLWTWEQLLELYEKNEQYTEERGNDNRWISFELLILEDDIQNGKRYLNVGISANDSRIGKIKGSVYQPFFNNFIFYQDGEIDMEES